MSDYGSLQAQAQAGVYSPAAAYAALGGGPGGAAAVASSQLQALVTFDDFSKLRVLPAQQYEASEKLKQQCQEFTSSISDFNAIIRDFTDTVSSKAAEIEREKLKAIGLRNRAMREQETRKRQEARYLTLIHERQAELDRLTAQLESLQKTEMEQAALMESLSNK
ncbi:hypothetical protein RI367_001376 [Sorochytrium milnesiophthora]